MLWCLIMCIWSFRLKMFYLNVLLGKSDRIIFYHCLHNGNTAQEYAVHPISSQLCKALTVYGRYYCAGRILFYKNIVREGDGLESYRVNHLAFKAFMLQWNGVWSAGGANKEVFTSKVETDNYLMAVKKSGQYSYKWN